MSVSAKKISFILHSSDLSKTWEFWTAIGISWHEGCDDPLGPWLTSEHDPLDDMGLPRATGQIGGVEFMFFRKPGERSGSWPENTLLSVYFDWHGATAEALKVLKKAGLFMPTEDFDPDFKVGVCDPDGRRVYLADPHPFRL